MSEWTHKGKPVSPEETSSYYGFVYKITDLTNNKKYIGRKYLHTRRKQKGKIRRVKADSDWINYFGSSKELLEEVQKKGKEKFKREILVFCKGKGETNFSEIFVQFLVGVLENDDWINDQINGKWYKKNVMNYDSVTELRALFLSGNLS